MRLINVDDETISLLEGAAIALEAALAARAARVDPDGILSRSFEMSRIKTGEAIRQFRRPKPKDWSEYTISERALFMSLITAFLDDDQEPTRSIIFRKIRGHCFRYHDLQDADPGGKAPIEGSIRDVTMAADAATAEIGTSAMRKKVRKGGDRSTPQDKAG